MLLLSFSYAGGLSVVQRLLFAWILQIFGFPFGPKAVVRGLDPWYSHIYLCTSIYVLLRASNVERGYAIYTWVRTSLGS